MAARGDGGDLLLPAGTHAAHARRLARGGRLGDRTGAEHPAPDMVQQKGETMTFAEKLREMYPEKDDLDLDEITAQLCPADLDLEAGAPESCPNRSGLSVGDLSACDRCWDRQIPEKEGD
jgi:hypothetical protein